MTSHGLPPPMNFSNGSKYEPKLETKFEPNLSTQQKVQEPYTQHLMAREQQQQRTPSPPKMASADRSDLSSAWKADVV